MLPGECGGDWRTDQPEREGLDEDPTMIQGPRAPLGSLSPLPGPLLGPPTPKPATAELTSPPPVLEQYSLGQTAKAPLFESQEYTSSQDALSRTAGAEGSLLRKQVTGECNSPAWRGEGAGGAPMVGPHPREQEFTASWDSSQPGGLAPTVRCRRQQWV